MKKPLLNVAMTLSLSAIAMPGQIYASNDSVEDIPADSNTIPGLSTGAVTGAIFAGPVGLLAGGIIGAFVGSSINPDDETESQNVTAAASRSTTKTGLLLADKTEESSVENRPSGNMHNLDNATTSALHLASAEDSTTLIDNTSATEKDSLVDILSKDLTLDIYFRSGSSRIESFYPARILAIARLMKSMETLDLHLDGYSDRRGDKEKNNALANKRIESVREHLIAAGIEDNRIVGNAFGETMTVSTAGDLDAYVFDRKVVIRFARRNTDSLSTMTSTLDKNKGIEDTVSIDDVAARF